MLGVRSTLTQLRIELPGATAQFTWDAGAGLPLLLADGTASYVYGPGGQILEQIAGSTPTYYHSDQLGSVRALTDQSGAVVATYAYDAYGQPTRSTGSASNPFRYAGQYRDGESGLYYLRARYYDPATAQFLTVDPLLAATQQAYAYAAGSPLNATDPDGQFVMVLIAPIAVVALAALLVYDIWYLQNHQQIQICINRAVNDITTNLQTKAPGVSVLPTTAQSKKLKDAEFKARRRAAIHIYKEKIWRLRPNENMGRDILKQIEDAIKAGKSPEDAAADADAPDFIR